MKKSKLLLFSAISGILLSLAWPNWGFPFLIFIALTPLLFILDKMKEYKHLFAKMSGMLYTFPAFVIWNSITTWWIWNSTSIGAIFAIVLNSFFMSLVFGMYHILKLKFFKVSKGYLALICFWIAWEYFHLDWDLSWSWLNLGNVFAEYPIFIQWYEITGVFGGTLWILLINILIYEIYLSFINLTHKNYKLTMGSLLGVVLFIPIILSIVRYYNYTEKVNPIDIVVIQQNTDPWEQYDIKSEQLIHNILELARQKVDSNTSLIIGPESAIQDYAWEDKLEDYLSIDSLKSFVDEHPHINFVLGISTLKMYKSGEKPSSTARKYGKEGNQFYDSYNTSMFVNSEKNIQFYHKSKLVPGVEKMPFPKYLKPLEKFALDLGGVTGSLGMDSKRQVFNLSNNKGVVGSAICYESIYGEFFSEFVKNGATVMTIITNDGWWGKTPGYRQHFQYARLRSVETRRSIARAANTGTSGFINQRGDVLQASQWWEPAVLKQTLNQNSELTFYTIYGDYIGRIARITSMLILFLYMLQILFPFIRKIR